MWGNVLEMVTRITKDVELYVVSKRNSNQPCPIIWVNDCETGLEGLWECSYTCKIM